MNWREEDYGIDINKEKFLKRYIKSELMNYYLYFDKYYELLDKRYSLYHKSIGGSVISMPDGSINKSSTQERAVMHEADIAEQQEHFVEKLEKIDSWMNILTRSQHEVVKVYVMKYQCENTHEAALELRYEENTVKKFTSRAINRIYSRMKNIM